MMYILKTKRGFVGLPLPCQTDVLHLVNHMGSAAKFNSRSEAESARELIPANFSSRAALKAGTPDDVEIVEIHPL